MRETGSENGETLDQLVIFGQFSAPGLHDAISEKSPTVGLFLSCRS